MSAEDGGLLKTALELFPLGAPYAIQREFMQSMTRTLQEARCGIFESPTGTVQSRAPAHSS